MSLKLSYSGRTNDMSDEVEAKVWIHEVIRIGGYFIDYSDFAEMVMYFFTNTDIEKGDVRPGLLKRLKKLEEVKGFNKGGKRYAGGEE